MTEKQGIITNKTIVLNTGEMYVTDSADPLGAAIANGRVYKGQRKNMLHVPLVNTEEPTNPPTVRRGRLQQHIPDYDFGTF